MRIEDFPQAKGRFLTPGELIRASEGNDKFQIPWNLKAPLAFVDP